MKNLKYIILFSLVILVPFGCADLDVENTNNPDTSRALSSADDLVSLLEGAFITMYSEGLTSTRVVNLDLQADAITSTNAFRNYWGDADEPRRKIDNSQTFDDKDNIEFLWSACYSTISSANNVLGAVDRGVFEDDAATILRVNAGSNFIKGLAIGYLGYVYDKGWIVNPDTDLDLLSLDDLVDYGQLIDESVRLLDIAIGFFNDGAPFDFIGLADAALASDQAAQLANSYKARFLAGKARTAAEAASADWGGVKAAAEKGLTEDYSPTSDVDVLWNGQHAWWTFDVGDGSAYLPVDLQVTNLADSSSPKVYPTDVATVLNPINTNDQRFGVLADGTGEDFTYTPNFGFLNEARNRSIFSNYAHYRYQYSYQTTNSGNPLHLFNAAEVELLLAEAEYQLGNYDAARAILDAGTRTVRGGLDPLADAAPETIENAIYYENMIELAQAGCGTALAFMRRYDRLQEGSYLHLPVPARDIELLGGTPDSYGGAGNGDGVNTANGSNAWK